MKKFKHRSGEFILGGRVYIMGIVNITPDSFSDGGLYCSPESAAQRALALSREGADIIDLGAMSTRPGSVPLSPGEELKRLRPVLEALKDNAHAPLSVDTVNPETAELALSLGADIINDVSGVFNPQMAKVVKENGAGWVVTHTGGLPAETHVQYPRGVVCHVKEFFEKILKECENAGIDGEYICLDPGFGFAKTTAQNLELLGNLEKLVPSDVAFLTGLSRKRFIGEVTGQNEPSRRDMGTAAADIIAGMKGSDFVRVHNVPQAVQTLGVLNSILGG